MAAGATHSLALTSSGQVYSFGEGSFGALGAASCTALWACIFLQDILAIGRGASGPLHIEHCSATLPLEGVLTMSAMHE